MKKSRFILTILAVSLILAVVLPMAVSAKPIITPLTPQPVTNLGLTAAYIAKPGEHISGIDISPSTVNGPYDIGIYIGVDNVTVTGTSISGANDEGILVQDAANVVIQGNHIFNNALDISKIAPTWPGPPPTNTNAEVKGIVLAGTKDSIVQGNLVEGNAHGGVSILDDGGNHVYSPASATLYQILPSMGNLIRANTVQDNPGDCAIVVAAKNPGPLAGVLNNTVSENQVLAPAGPSPYVGGIIVAGGGFGPVNVIDTLVENNTVTGGDIPGISIHAFGPATISGTRLIGNILSNNGAGELSGNTTGIEIFAVPVGKITGTEVSHDSVSNDHYGVWHVGDTGTLIGNLTTSGVAVPVYP